MLLPRNLGRGFGVLYLMENENDFDQEKIDALKRQLASEGGGEVVQGRIEWLDDLVKGTVVFIPDPNGMFLLNTQYIPKP